MHPAIRADQHLRELALAEARNRVGPDEPMAVFLSQEALSQAEYDEIAKNPVYQGYVKAYMADLRDSGFSFSAKARVLAEDLLADVYLMAKDADTPAAMRVKTLENLVEWGRLAPKQNAEVATGPGYSITINLSDRASAKSITVENAAAGKQPTSISLPHLTASPGVADAAYRPVPETAPSMIDPFADPELDAYYAAEYEAN